MAGKKEASFYFRMDPQLLERLEEISFNLNASKSVIIRMALVKFLEEHEKTVIKKKVHCINCGAKLPPNAIFCPACGEKIE